MIKAVDLHHDLAGLPVLKERYCLKKNGTLAWRHWWRIDSPQAGCIGRAPGPLSPPTMTQWIPSIGKASSGPSKGSQDKNRTCAAHRLFFCVSYHKESVTWITATGDGHLSSRRSLRHRGVHARARGQREQLWRRADTCGPMARGSPRCAHSPGRAHLRRFPWSGCVASCFLPSATARYVTVKRLIFPLPAVPGNNSCHPGSHC